MMRLLSQNEEKAQAKQGQQQQEFRDSLKREVKQRLRDELEQVSIFAESTKVLRDQWRPRVRQVVNQVAPKTADPAEMSSMVEEILQEIFGMGKLQPYLDDPVITDIMVVGGRDVYVMRHGKKEKADLVFEDPEEVVHLVRRIASDPMVNRRIDESSPMLDARLPDGSRLHALIPPVVPDGPTISIRKFPEKVPEIDDLIRWGSITQEAADFLRACVRARLNLVVTGGTGSGKSTLLNILAEAIPDEERIVTIEDSLELQIHRKKPHVVRLEARPPSVEGKGEIPISRLVKETLRMLPDRIIVGECRREETAEMLNAMNTGHDGSMTTMHANSPRDAIGRMIYMAMMSGTDIPYLAWHKMIASAVNLIVHLERLYDGSRKVTRITEVNGTDPQTGEVALRDLFVFVQEESGPDGKIRGQLKPTGVVPNFHEMFRRNQVHYDLERLAQGVMGSA